MARFSFYLLLCLSLVCLCGCRKNRRGPAKKEHTVRVTTGKLEKRGFARKIPVLGTVEPVEYAVLSAKVNGTLDKLHVDEGAIRAQKDILFEIDREILQNQLTFCENEVHLRRAEIENAKIAVESAEISRTQAKNDFERTRNLHKKKVVSQANFEQDEAKYKKAETAYQSALSEVKSAEARLLEAQSDLTIAMKKLDDSTQSAPFDCVVTEKYVEENEYVTAGQKILKLENPKKLEVVCHISAIYYDQIRPGETAVEFFQNGKSLGRTTITYRAPNITPASRTFKVKIAVPPEIHMVSGMLCNLDLILEEKDGWGLPADALLLRSNNRHIAYTVNEKMQAQSVELKPGIRDGSHVEILNASEHSDKTFVVTGQTFLNNGTRLEVIAP